MPALNFLIPAGWGAPTLCFEGSPASAHLRGRAGSLCPPLSSPDSSRRHLSPPAWCERAGRTAEPVGGGPGSPSSPASTAAAKPSWRGKDPASHCWDLPVAPPWPEPQGLMAWGGLQGALGLLRPQQGLICPAQILLHPPPAGGQGMQWVPVGGEQGCSALPAMGAPRGSAAALAPHPARDRLLGSGGV